MYWITRSGSLPGCGNKKRGREAHKTAAEAQPVPVAYRPEAVELCLPLPVPPRFSRRIRCKIWLCPKGFYRNFYKTYFISSCVILFSRRIRCRTRNLRSQKRRRKNRISGRARPVRTEPAPWAASEPEQDAAYSPARPAESPHIGAEEPAFSPSV